MNSGRCLLIFFILGLMPLSAFAAQSSIVVLSQTVGAIGDDIVSTRDVQIQAVIERILYPEKSAKSEVGADSVAANEKNNAEKVDSKKNKKSKSKAIVTVAEKKILFEISYKEPHFQNELASTLLEFVILKEAESFQVAKPNDSELKDAVQKVEKAVAGHSYWNHLEVSSEELSSVVNRKLTAKKFIKIKTDLMTALVTDQDALNYYERNRIKFGQLPFSSFKDNIKAFLSQQQLEDRIKTLFEVIKRKYKVRNYLAEGRSVE